MIYIVLNAWPITIAALAAVGLGLVWYRRPRPLTIWVTSIAAHLWLGAILAGALILAPPKGGVWTMTIGSAIVIWAGFIAPVLAATYRVRDIGWRAAASDAGFWLVAIMVQAAMMRWIGLVPPPA
jgi:hypothetical protein